MLNVERRKTGKWKEEAILTQTRKTAKGKLGNLKLWQLSLPSFNIQLSIGRLPNFFSSSA